MTYPKYEKYKDSGVTWLGMVPTQWKVHRLGEIVDIRTSNVDKKIHEGEKSVWLCNYVDVYYNQNIRDNISFMRASASDAQISRFSLQKGDVVITKDSESADDIGIPAYIAEDIDELICGYHLSILRCFPQQSCGAFLFYLLKSSISAAQFEVNARGVTRFGLSADGIKNIRLSLPPLLEQKIIAEFLDKKTAEIDTLIAKKQELLKLLTEKRTALITQAVTKGLDSNVPMKDSEIDWLGKTPKEWGIKKVKHIVRFAYGDSLPAEQRIDGVYFVYGSNGPVGIHEEKNTLSPAIIIGRKGSFGKLHYIEKPGFAIDTTYFVDKRTTKNHLKWVYYALGVLRLDEVSKDSAVPGLSREEAYSHFLPLPSYSVQEAVVEFLDKKTAEIEEIQAKIEDAIECLKEYRMAIITNTVTGRVKIAETYNIEYEVVL